MYWAFFDYSKKLFMKSSLGVLKCSSDKKIHIEYKVVLHNEMNENTICKVFKAYGYDLTLLHRVLSIVNSLN